ncbi:Endonuclease 8-like 3 [Durusdinium trenchii]|uniref:Endonuclease 8-like 3 n=1 Tax=Durusdinium trenchii TaxID=1381693 RepID=A0ABP0Q4Z4_9DINO
MDKLTKFVKEQSLQRSERSARAEEQAVQWLVELGGRGPKAAADFGFASQVANLTKDHNDEVAAAALRTLGDFGPEGAKHMGAVASGLNRSPEVCIAAAVALAEFGPQALGYGDTLAMCLERTRDENAKAAVLAALGAVGAEQHAGLCAKYLEDSSVAVSAAACQALGRLGSAGAADAPRIAEKLADPSKRFAAVTALGYLGTETVKRNMSQIVSCLKDKDSLTRQAAATTLGVASDAVLAGGDATSIVALLKDPNPGTRCAAALALGKLGAVSSAAEVAELLGDNAEDASESHLTVGGGALRSAAALRRPKCAALASLGLMKSEKHLPLLSGALRDKSYEVRLSALEALMQVGHAAAKYSTSIMSVMEDDVYLVRLKACQTIAAIGATDVMDNLPDLFQDEAPSVRQAALDALATNSDIGKKYSSQVFKCITDEYGCVRAAAMRCLASMESVGQCYASTIAGELSSQDPESRAAACETLGKLGDYGAAFTEEMEVCQHDEIPMVREAAAHALVTWRI